MFWRSIKADIGSQLNSRRTADLGVFNLVRSAIFAALYFILSKASLLVADKGIHIAQTCAKESIKTEFQHTSPKLIMVRNPHVERFQLWTCPVTMCMHWTGKTQISKRCLWTLKVGATSGEEIANPSGAPEFTPGFSWGSCYSIFSFMCMFCRSLFVLLYFFFGHCVVCSSIYGFWLPLWYLQTLLK
jgi:hypothetical protein